jgi:DNA-binding MarR family transcriptional regulator
MTLEAPKRALPAPDNALAHHDRSVALDRLLESVHREQLSPVDLRLLLRVTDREATIGELADSMGQPPSVLRPASARLVARGLLRRRSRHQRLGVTLAATASGMSALRRVTQALEVARTDPASALTAPARLTAAASIPSGAASSRMPAVLSPRRKTGA